MLKAAELWRRGQDKLVLLSFGNAFCRHKLLRYPRETENPLILACEPNFCAHEIRVLKHT